jgi:hypothetical protein
MLSAGMMPMVVPPASFFIGTEQKQHALSICCRNCTWLRGHGSRMQFLDDCNHELDSARTICATHGNPASSMHC